MPKIEGQHLKRFGLVDDGTLDTVIQCQDCNEEIRYSPDPPLDDHNEACGDRCECQDARIEEAYALAEEHHHCQG